jgi:hypothetical protein
MILHPRAWQFDSNVPLCREIPGLERTTFSEVGKFMQAISFDDQRFTMSQYQVEGKSHQSWAQWLHPDCEKAAVSRCASFTVVALKGE